MIGPVGNTTFYPSVGSNAIGTAVNPVSRIKGVSSMLENSSINVDKVNPSECQTCNNRKYIDKSNDSNVSFQTPTHISPAASYASVSSHEQEHVANATSEGSRKGNQLVSTSVSLKTSICPECGTSYVSGGTTTSQIRYNESNPYESSRKSVEESMLKGMYIDYVA